jgi:hypothetical protein
LVPTQKAAVGHEPGKILGAPPVVKGVIFHVTLAGLFEVMMLPWSLITQNEVEGHDSPVIANGIRGQNELEAHDDEVVPALGSTCVLCQASAPPVGSVEAITSPALSPARQRVAVLHTTAVSETEQ